MDLFSVSKTSISAIRPLTDDEFATYEAAVQALRQFDRGQGGFGFLQQSHFEFEKELSTIEAEVRVLGGEARNRSDISMRVNLRVLNFLSASRLYLDHTAYRLSRTYGKQSPEMMVFEEATKAAYDRSFAYRFLYKLRNFGQHCGMPVGHAALNSRLVDPPKLEAKHELQISFRTEELLAEDRAVWGQVARELEEVGPELDVAPLVREKAALIRDVHRDVTTKEEPRVRASAAQVHSILKDGFVDGGVPAVGDFQLVEHPLGGMTFTVSALPADLMRTLGYAEYRNP